MPGAGFFASGSSIWNLGAPRLEDYKFCFPTIIDKDYEILKKLGYSEADIANFVNNGIEFRLVSLPPQNGVVLGTWDNRIPMIRANYPTIASKIEGKLADLKKYTGPSGYRKIMSEAPAEAKQTKMTLDQLEKSKGELWEVRKFLHDQINLNELYMGDGYTYSIDARTQRDEPGVREYFTTNRSLSEFKAARTTSLPVDIPTTTGSGRRPHTTAIGVLESKRVAKSLQDLLH